MVDVVGQSVMFEGVKRMLVERRKNSKGKML